MEVELAGSDDDSDDAIDWEADASESDDEAPAPRPPDAHPRAPEAPEDAAPPPKRRKVSYREAQAAKQRREARVLVHKACVVCFLGRLRLLSRWCDDDVATTAAVGAMPPHVAKRLADTTDDDGDAFVGGVLGAVEAVRRAVLGRRMEARDARELGSPPGDLAKRVVRDGGAHDRGREAVSPLLRELVELAVELAHRDAFRVQDLEGHLLVLLVLTSCFV